MTDNIKKGLGYGFLRDDGKFCMIKCCACGRQNYAPSVMSGTCAWCSYDANIPLDEERGEVA